MYDLFHTGHYTLLSRAMKMCDRLIVGIHTDEFVTKYKRKPQQDQETRRRKVIDEMKIPEADTTIVGPYHTETIKNFGVTKVIHGNDWEINSYKKQIRYYEDGLDKLGVEVCIVPYTKGISTTQKVKKSLPSIVDYEVFLFDLDNTLMLGPKAMPFAVKCVQELKKLGRDVNVLSNNNRYTPTQITENLNAVGIEVDEKDVYSSLRQVATHLNTTVPNGRIFVWGTKASTEWLQKQGVSVVTLGQAQAGEVDAVAVLYRNDYDYQELTALCTVCAKTPYICGNKDWTYPDEALVKPDTGAIVQLITSCTGQEPTKVCGKPCPEMFPFNPKRCVMIGDSLRTDKEFAKNAKMDFIHVSTHDENADISHLGVLCDYMDLLEM